MGNELAYLAPVTPSDFESSLTKMEFYVADTFQGHFEFFETIERKRVVIEEGKNHFEDEDGKDRESKTDLKLNHNYLRKIIDYFFSNTLL